MENLEIKAAPAPWALMGSGYIILLKMSGDFVETEGFVPESLKGSFAGGFGTVMYVDYTYSDAGPYQEILFIPGMFSFTTGRYFSITRIFVSTMESVVNGQNNWGIPKEVAQFEYERPGRSVERIRIIKDGSAAAELTFRSYNLRLPVTTSLVPPAWRTLAHHHEGKTYLTTPMARGSISPARLVNCNIKRSLFPDFTKGRIISAFKVPRFYMVFPKARII
ncbi:MAG: acetoacetate decarboxylase family protein [Deltaproteobacteria bacterium]|nr:acetoacetate decarboxylase family protein [Deltaproteobacteria bacterium]